MSLFKVDFIKQHSELQKNMGSKEHFVHCKIEFKTDFLQQKVKWSFSCCAFVLCNYEFFTCQKISRWDEMLLYSKLPGKRQRSFEFILSSKSATIFPRNTKVNDVIL